MANTKKRNKPRKRSRRVVREGNATGNCFEDSAEHVLHAAMMGNSNLVLVHGEVLGRGPLDGIRHAHAWVEDGDEVFDVAQQVRLPRIAYYALGCIDQINNMHRYTADDIKRLEQVIGVPGISLRALSYKIEWCDATQSLAVRSRTPG